jgi:hypothetical protein
LGKAINLCDKKSIFIPEFMLGSQYSVYYNDFGKFQRLAPEGLFAWRNLATAYSKHSTAQHSTAQHSTAQHSTACKDKIEICLPIFSEKTLYANKRERS